MNKETKHDPNNKLTHEKQDSQKESTDIGEGLKKANRWGSQFKDSK